MINSILILLGAILMVFNIIRYWKFMEASGEILEENRRLLMWRNAGLLFLSFFLIGYIVAAFNATSLILALVFFFGSIYVYVSLALMMQFVSTQREMMNEALIDASDTEVMTGLYSLNGFSRHAMEIVQANPAKTYMVIQWDLDEFKVYNDINGYENGDALLRGIGHASHDQIRNGLVFGHLNSDHFVLLAEKTDQAAEEIYSDIEEMLRNLSSGAALNFHMGICTIDSHQESIASLCDHALIALRTVKGQYQEHYAWYKPDMRSMIVEENRLVAEMENALSSGQFRVWYQPQVNYKSGKICGAEALVRWIHPEKGIIPPIQFIPLFEKNGFITKLDHYIWDRVCSFQREWIDSGHEAYPVSINISRRDIYSDDLVKAITSLIQKYRLDPSLLHLEITESVYMTSPEKMNRIVDTLQAKGFHVEIDDFGSGYSSLNTLKDMKVSTLKLDMKFLQQSENSDRSGRIISAMIRMADWLDVSTIAEGVETKEQADFLKSMGCYHLQGYYFYKPMKEEDYKRVLSDPDVARADKPLSRKYLEDSLDFMDSSLQSTLMFNSFTGNAMIADYHNGILELLRINDRLMNRLHEMQEDQELYRRNMLLRLEEDQQLILKRAMDEAVAQNRETECVIRVLPANDLRKVIWLNMHMRVISSRGRSAVLYFSLEDITDHWKMEELEKELEKIFRNIPAGIVTFELSSSGEMEAGYISDYVYEMFHLDPEQYRSGEDRIMSEIAITREMTDELAADPSHGIHCFERLVSRSSDGTRFWLETTMILRAEDGRQMFYALLNDVTERYEKDAQQHAFMKAVPGGLVRYSCDEKEEISYISEGLLDLLGYRRDEFRDHYHDRFSNIVYEEDRERVLSEINEQVRESGNWDMCKYRVLTRKGQLRWVYDAAYITTDSNGRKWFNVVILDLNMQTDNARWISG